MPTYYDSVALLASSDAIDTTEHVPFRLSGSARPPPVVGGPAPPLSVALPAPYPPPLAPKPAAVGHHYLAHTAPSVALFSTGSMSYAHVQRLAYAQMSKGQPPATRQSLTQERAAADMAARAPPPKQPAYLHTTVSREPQQTYSQARPAPQPRPAQSSNTTGPQGPFRSEECHVCRRTFKGPKASTHKQQHIRRLHPNEYMPKRGGKKRIPGAY